ncbi:hypothetical protein [Pantoea vagans]|uniref:hypothetical protein n=1 Tax=Pantoea vagans TaxID=470934 RepID=UPI0030170426
MYMTELKVAENWLVNKDLLYVKLNPEQIPRVKQQHPLHRESTEVSGAERYKWTELAG